MFPLAVTSDQIQAWQHFHEKKAIDAVLHNRLNDLKALIDIDFVKRIYDDCWHYMQDESRNNLEIIISAQERSKAIRLWGNQQTNSLDHYLQIARKTATERLITSFNEIQDQTELSNNEKTEACRQYQSTLLEVLDTNGLSNNAATAQIGTEEIANELQRLQELIDDTKRKTAVIENARQWVDPYFHPITAREGEQLDRYFEFLIANLDGKPELLTHDNEAPGNFHTMFTMPEPYRTVIKMLADSRTLAELLEAGFNVVSGPIKEDREDDEVMSRLSNEKMHRETRINELKREIKSSSKTEKILLNRELTDNQNAIKRILSKITRLEQDKLERLHNTKAGIFKDNFCQHHAIAISPNLIIPDEIVNQNNLTINNQARRPIASANKLLLIKGDALLDVALKREFYVPATWLMLQGADPLHKNAEEISAFSYLIAGKITGISNLAIELTDILVKKHAKLDSPLASAARYKKARESNYIKENNTLLATPAARMAFKQDTSAILGQLRQMISYDQTIIARTRLQRSFLYRLEQKIELLWRLGYISIDDLSARINDLRDELLTVKQALINSDAVGHDEHIASHLGQLSTLALTLKGYEGIAEALKTIKQEFHEINDYGRKHNDKQNLALTETILETSRNLLILLRDANERANISAAETREIRKDMVNLKITTQTLSSENQTSKDEIQTLKIEIQAERERNIAEQQAERERNTAIMTNILSQLAALQQRNQLPVLPQTEPLQENSSHAASNMMQAASTRIHEQSSIEKTSPINELETYQESSSSTGVTLLTQHTPGQRRNTFSDAVYPNQQTLDKRRYTE